METVKHECGVAMIRLLKPLEYYQQKYGTWRYGLNKLYLLMEKQHNRGQEGAGMACVNLDAPVGTEYMFRERAEGANAITEIFKKVDHSFNLQEGGPFLRRPAVHGTPEVFHHREKRIDVRPPFPAP